MSISDELGQVLLKRKIIMVGITFHNAAEVSAWGDRKPLIIPDYNTNNRGVDRLEIATGRKSCKRRTACWPLTIFHNITDRGEKKKGELCKCHCIYTSTVRDRI